MTLSLPIEPQATKLLHDSPIALLLGMLLEQYLAYLRKRELLPFVLPLVPAYTSKLAVRLVSVNSGMSVR